MLNEYIYLNIGIEKNRAGTSPVKLLSERSLPPAFGGRVQESKRLGK